MLILASLSPRRKELLGRLLLPFEVIAANVNEEEEKKDTPEQTVLALSFQKAMAVAKDHPHDLVLGADTVVALNHVILGKPHSRKEAFEMLSLLSGRTHQVFSGFTIVGGDRIVSRFEKTDVTFSTLTREEIEWYLDSGEPFDKAGAYGIQGLGALLVKEIRGDYNNVVGLPLKAVYDCLKKEFGVNLK